MITTAAPWRRVQAVDVARAVAVIGVVVNHCIDGLLNAGLIPADHALERVNAALYVFRMPALALLLGLFIPRAVEKRGPLRYVAERASLMLYLYVLWFLVEGAAESSSSGVKNMSRPWSELFTFWTTFAHLWFLPFLVVATVVLTLLQPWRPGLRGAGALVALLVLSLATWGWNPTVIGGTGLSLILFAGVGSAIGLPRMGALLERSAWGWTAVGAVAAAAFVTLFEVTDLPPSTTIESASLGARAVSLVAALLGITVLLAVSVLLARVPAAVRPLAAVGRRTLPIYLAHVIVVAGVRVVMVRAGVEEPYVVALVAVPLGVLVPLALAVLAEPRPWAAWVFDLPAPLRERLRHVPSGRPAISTSATA